MWSRNSKSQPFYESIWVPDLPKQAHVLGRPLHLSIWHQQRRNHARRWQRRCVNMKDQEITRRVIVVWTLRTNISPGGWLLCEHEGPGDHQAGNCSVNPKDQHITRRVIVVWTRRAKRSPGGWLLCEPEGPGDHQEGDCCVNPEDLEITRRVIVVWTQRT